MAKSDEGPETTEQLLGPTVPNLKRKFFIDSPTTLFKYGGTEDEGKMTMFARSILGPCVPRITSFVTIAAYSRPGLILTRQEGKPIEEIWPSLTIPQREGIKTELCSLVLRMRAQTFSYYGRPSRQPYVLVTIHGPQEYVYCASRAEWDDSRVKALRASQEAEADRIDRFKKKLRETNDGAGCDHPMLTFVDRSDRLEKLQSSTNGPAGWDRPVLTHVDLSDRNILVDPGTLKVTGFLDWETANIMPAYFEYASARLAGGHDPSWRKEILNVLRSVLRHECNARAANAEEGEEMYKETLAAWDTMTDVERTTQGYSDDCFWTFEPGLPEDSKDPGATL